jgi:hypothetical protein
MLGSSGISALGPVILRFPLKAASSGRFHARDFAYTEMRPHKFEREVMTNEHKLIWANRADPKGWPEFQEGKFTGAFSDALSYMQSLAKGARFIVGQVLAEDGKVLANVAPQGTIRLSSD